jgi:methylenetetrahydrofolate reductase (NADPH)
VPYSLESTTQPRAIDLALAAPLPRGASVYLTSLLGDAPGAVIEAARRLRRGGLNPVPHLSARSFAAATDLDDRVARLAAEAEVRQVLVIGGDIDRPRGSFGSSRALIATGVLEKHGIRSVGLAAYPEGHPRIAAAVLDQELAAKIATLQARGIAPYIVTQFCFEAAPIAALLGRLATRFPGIPVHLGLAGPAKLTTLLRYAASCGIGASLRALRGGASLSKLMTESGAEPILVSLARDDAACAAIAQLHFFTFGGVTRTAQWAQALAQGAFALTPDGAGLIVETLAEIDTAHHMR